ncbi:Delta(7)-sterol 5(6)-desaturase erg32, partial [Frankliniella fusca]
FNHFQSFSISVVICFSSWPIHHTRRLLRETFIYSLIVRVNHRTLVPKLVAEVIFPAIGYLQIA